MPLYLHELENVVKYNKKQKTVGNENGNTYGRYAKKEQKTRYGDFDPKEAFRKALERSCPGEDVDKIVEEYYST